MGDNMKDPFFEEFERMRREMEKLMHHLMPTFDEKEIEKLFKEGKPSVYGFQISIGPDGEPKIREFGNIKPMIKAKEEGKEDLIGVREPLIEVYRNNKDIKVIAEMPGVNKEDIHLTLLKGDTLEIKVDTETRRYYKKVKLPVIVTNDIKARYKNGVLEVTIPIKNPIDDKKQIKIE